MKIFYQKESYNFFTFKTNKHTVNLKKKCQLPGANNSFEYSYRVSSTVMFCTAGGDPSDAVTSHMTINYNMVASWFVHAF